MPALVTSRICHDLANPLMAIANGLELLELSGLADTPEAALLADSVDAARARMESFRMAFGFAGEDDLLASRKCGDTLARSLRERNIRLLWGLEGEIPRRRARLLCLLVFCAETALSRGGEIRVAEADGGLRILASGPTLRELGPLWDMLSGRGSALPAASEVHFALARQALEQSGCSARVRAGDAELEIRAWRPPAEDMAASGQGNGARR